jgi:general secretion pathway protein G
MRARTRSISHTTGGGFTLVEMLVVTAMLSVLALAVVPLAEISQTRWKERELRAALREIRQAIDAYKRLNDEASAGRQIAGSGYPPTLEALMQGSSGVSGAVPSSSKRLLRRLPRDPFAPDGVPAEQSWGLRSYASSDRSPTPGDDVYDVYSLSRHCPGTLVTMRTPARSCRGFTVIELLVVLAAVALLVSLVAPRYVQHVDRAREAALRSNLAALRDAIDKYEADRGALPQRLDDLVQARYLRAVPIDPFTERADTWVVVPASTGAQDNVADVRSGAPGLSREGKAYATW